MYDLCIKNGQVYQEGSLVKTNVYITDGVISCFSRESYQSKEVYDAVNKLVFPGLIDPHVHFDLNLGFIRSRDGFDGGTRAAAYGGITTIIDFLDPINHASLLEPALRRRLKEAQHAHINYLFHATVRNPVGQVSAIIDEMNRLDLHSVKCFTTYSDSDRRTYDEELKTLLIKAKEAHIRVLAHIEKDDLITINSTMTIEDLPVSRPPQSETEEALKLAKLVKDTKTELYMVHCSSGTTLQALKEQFKDLLNTQFFVESCPHYFMFNQTVLQQDNGYLYTMAPPLRTQASQRLLNDHFDDVYTIGTDHCAFNQNDKKNRLLYECPLGVGGVEQSFDVMYAQYGLDVVPKMSENVAKVYHLYPKKGVLQVGSDADMMVYEPGDFSIDQSHSDTDTSLYQGMKTRGRVVSTLINGEFVIKDRKFIQSNGHYLGGMKWDK